MIVVLCVVVPLAIAIVATVIVRFWRNHKSTMTKLSVKMSALDDGADDEVSSIVLVRMNAYRYVRLRSAVELPLSYTYYQVRM
jgi:hypothetical protein